MSSHSNHSQCDDFIEHIFNKYAKIQCNEIDIQNQKDFVINIIHNIANEIKSIDQNFTVDRVTGTGSYFSGTKVIAPDEFDFLTIIRTKYLALEKGCKNGFSHVKVISDAFKRHLLSDTVRGKIKERSVKHFPHEVLEDDYLSPCIIQYFYHLVDQALVKLNERNLVKYNKDAKRVKSEKEIEGELLATQMCSWTWPYGPYIKLLIPGPVCIASVDFTFAFEIWNPDSGNYHPVLLIPKAPADLCKYFTDKIDDRSIYDNSICWTQTLSHTETKIIKNFKPEHKKIQMVLKLLNETEYLGQKYSAFDSYAIKTLVYHHDQKCTNVVKLSDCFREIVNQIKDLLYAEMFDIQTNVRNRLIFSLIYARKVVEHFEFLNSELETLRPFKHERENKNIDDIKDVFSTLKTLYQNIIHDDNLGHNATPNNAAPNKENPNDTAPKNAAPNKEDPNDTALKSAAPNKEDPNDAAPKSVAPTKEDPNDTALKSVAPTKEDPNDTACAAPNKEDPNDTAPKSAAPNNDDQNDAATKNAAPNNDDQTSDPANNPVSHMSQMDDYINIKTFVETLNDKRKVEELQNSFAEVFQSILQIYDNKANADSTAGMEYILHQIFLDFYKTRPKFLASMHDPEKNILGQYFHNVDWLKLTDGWMEIWGVTRKIARSHLVSCSFVELLGAIDGTKVDEIIVRRGENSEDRAQQRTGIMTGEESENTVKKDWDKLLKEKATTFNHLGDLEPNWLWQFVARGTKEKQ
ncbi:unnamed protein product [Owenia fusiformis]|uniref:Uncharacterized protein n=1 Tax=Owenia fusiformis TaxID=6347 RepID=A0A8J1XPC0_OWEFU|nr:unnamed protein product [Owenia fusiformis]